MSGCLFQMWGKKEDLQSLIWLNLEKLSWASFGHTGKDQEVMWYYHVGSDASHGNPIIIYYPCNISMCVKHIALCLREEKKTKHVMLNWQSIELLGVGNLLITRIYRLCVLTLHQLEKCNKTSLMLRFWRMGMTPPCEKMSAQNGLWMEQT